MHHGRRTRPRPRHQGIALVRRDPCLRTRGTVGRHLISAPEGPRPSAVTSADEGDNIGVCIPVFATADVGGMSVYAVVFLVLVAVWCFTGKLFATRPVIAKALSRLGHILQPLALIAIGLLILIEGGAFGLRTDPTSH
ncbi:cadmium resistance transporter [Streptomyces sp. NPDC048473]|uniref:cadmium resistance transporter n=1 Tax=unclassified Streptomyces TaxID=2593676 RepID=UPI0037150A65